MPVNDTVSKWVTLPLRKRLTRFAREDDGLVTILALFMIMMMIPKCKYFGAFGKNLKRNFFE